jgi:hypothetical protein
MASYDAIWVKIVDVEGDLVCLRENYKSNAQLTQNSPFVCAKTNISDGEFPEELLEELAQDFEEVIFMLAQTTSDFFLYSHWSNGEKVRELGYFSDEGWYLVNGKKETWENDLFQEANKIQQLGYLDMERLANDPNARIEYQQAKEQAEEIESVWSTAELCEGYFYPMATANEMYDLVKYHFKLS